MSIESQSDERVILHSSYVSSMIMSKPSFHIHPLMKIRVHTRACCHPWFALFAFRIDWSHHNIVNYHDYLHPALPLYLLYWFLAHRSVSLSLLLSHCHCWWGGSTASLCYFASSVRRRFRCSHTAWRVLLRKANALSCAVSPIRLSKYWHKFLTMSAWIVCSELILLQTGFIHCEVSLTGRCSLIHYFRCLYVLHGQNVVSSETSEFLAWLLLW